MSEPATHGTAFAIVVPTIGRASLPRLLESLEACAGPRPAAIVLADDRPGAAGGAAGLPALPELPTGWTADLVSVVRSGGRGPAAARNAGWRAVRADVEWISFLDDDVLVTSDWLENLATDLGGCDAGVGGVQGLVSVPLPAHRRPTDWERGTAGLATAKWITADMAYRLPVLRAVGGFDERFPRAYREDADIALRVENAGFALRTGTRGIVHPVRPARWNASLRQQRGNADDVLMIRLHGRGWWQRAQAPVGTRARHLGVTGAGLAALVLVLARRRRAGALAALAWAAGTADFARVRIKAGPRTPGEVARMAATSVAIPPAAVWHWARGLVVHRAAQPVAQLDGSRVRPPAEKVSQAEGPGAARATEQSLAVSRSTEQARVSAVLLDRDGTIVRDVAYNADAALVEPMPGARDALDRLRAAGLPLAVVTNQSGVARGLISADALAAVNARVEEVLGPFDVWQMCVHGADEGCDCRKPEPGMVLAAAAALNVPVGECVLIGDIGSDVEAAQRAGAQSALVPTSVTRQAEIDAAPHVFATLAEAVDDILARTVAS